MKEYQHKESKGSLFKTKEKRHADSPDYYGGVRVNGMDCKISGWITEAKSGLKYISLAIQQEENPQPKQYQTPHQHQTTPDAYQRPAPQSNGVPQADTTHGNDIPF